MQRDTIVPVRSSAQLASQSLQNPAAAAGMGGAIGMVRNWTYTLLFVAGELWGDVVLSLLFWGLANELTHMSEVCCVCIWQAPPAHI